MKKFILFTCFALATLWIRYEMSYDKFHRDAEHIYAVYHPDNFNLSGLSRHANYRLAAYLKETFEMLHTQGEDYIVNEIDLFINARKR